MTDAKGFLDEVPRVDLMEAALNLSRPELTAIMGRSVSESQMGHLPLFRPPNALIVTRAKGQEAPLRQAFEKEGWCVKTCAGPGQTACPIMRGERCSLRESVDAAVVYLDPRESDRCVGTVPRLRCAADSSSPAVVALEGSLGAPRFSGTTATVGSLRGPRAVLDAIAAPMGSGTSD